MDSVRHAFFFVSALVLSVAVHEFGHAWTATRLGDPLPRAQGRLSLSPMRHIDPFGTLLLPFLMSFSSFGAFGWGRPVETNPSSYTRRISRATGNVLVSISGPFMNLMMALVVSGLIVVAARMGAPVEPYFGPLFGYLVRLNILLMFFNLLPIPPLDGGSLLAWTLPRSQQHLMDFLSKWGFLIILAMLMIPQIASVVFAPVFALSSWWKNVLFGVAFP